MIAVIMQLLKSGFHIIAMIAEHLPAIIVIILKTWFWLPWIMASFSFWMTCLEVHVQYNLQYNNIYIVLIHLSAKH